MPHLIPVQVTAFGVDWFSCVEHLWQTRRIIVGESSCQLFPVWRWEDF